jgi:AraC-like DNA-binding protein
MAKLAMLLLPHHEKREVAKALSLPLSTLYRWVERYVRDPVRQRKALQAAEKQELLGLIAECEAHGFEFRKSVFRLLTSDPPQSEIAAQSQCGNVSDIAPQDIGNATQLRELPPVRRQTDHDAAAKLSARAHAGIETARHTIDTRYYSKLSCDALAAAAMLSKWHFIKLFKATYGIAPYQYLTRIRVQHAKHLLDTTAYSLETIAMAVGFDAGSSLSRAFRAVEGVNLSAFFKGRKIRYLSGPAAVTSA